MVVAGDRNKDSTPASPVLLIAAQKCTTYGVGAPACEVFLIGTSVASLASAPSPTTTLETDNLLQSTQGSGVGRNSVQGTSFSLKFIYCSGRPQLCTWIDSKDEITKQRSGRENAMADRY